MMVTPSVGARREGGGGGWAGDTSGRVIDGLDSAVQDLGVGVGVELHFFGSLSTPSVLHAAKLSLGSGLTVPVSVAPGGAV